MREKHAAERVLRVAVNVVVAKINLSALPSLAAKLQELRVDRVNYMPIQRHPELALSPQEIAWFRSTIKPSKDHYDPNIADPEHLQQLG